MLVHAALAILLGRLSGSSDIVVGTPIAGRGAAELDDVVGMFVNTLPLRTRVELGGTFSGLVDDVRTADLGAFGNADVPFESIVDAVVPSRSQGRHPIFQVALSFQNLERVKLDLPGLTVEGLDTGELAAKFDLQFTIEPRTSEEGSAAGLFGSLLYATDLFDEDTARSFADRFTRILRAVAEDPYVVVGDVDIMSAIERTRSESGGSSNGGSGAVTPVPDRSVPQVFGAVVELEPEAPAIAHDGEEVTYLDLEGRSSRLARLLIARGIGPGDRVVVDLEPSVDWAVAVLAVLLSGAAIVVADKSTSLADRIRISGAGAVVGSTGTGTETIALDDPATVDALGSGSPRPIAYSSRTRLLGIDDAAVVVLDDHSVVEHTQAKLVADLIDSGRRLDVTFESRLTAEPAAGEVWQITALLGAMVAGAVWVVPTRDEQGELLGTLLDEWVTHAFVPTAVAEALAPEQFDDLIAVVVAEMDGGEQQLEIDGVSVLANEGALGQGGETR
jgi:non-ribosomal peptide synthetase component F